MCTNRGFPAGSAVKEPACNAGDSRGVPGSLPWSGRSPGEGNGNPLQYSCLENPMNSPWGHKRVGLDLATKQQQQCTNSMVLWWKGTKYSKEEWGKVRVKNITNIPCSWATAGSSSKPDFTLVHLPGYNWFGTTQSLYLFLSFCLFFYYIISQICTFYERKRYS